MTHRKEHPMIKEGIPLEVWRYHDGRNYYYVMQKHDVPSGEKPEKRVIRPLMVLQGVKIVSFEDN